MPFEVNAEVVEALARQLRPRIHARTGTDFALRIRPLWGGEDDPLAWEADTDDADLLVIGTSQARRSTALRRRRAGPHRATRRAGAQSRPPGRARELSAGHFSLRHIVVQRIHGRFER
jgi:hypothetical protein